ncbi:alpha/beta fold hydrolase [Rudaeicoccus suwonensis]|uniref:Pimeloyl-ACP methyl ester carboxylesterase n=1 Tax=Rudaeicoccus suwonensis TaxID=657409 RepID=A0A561EC71_9MICO|nr:alpha/beta fold hydrolase [Rudaeicoccus suwonensis]TWE13203.1 pimeloyl-ACP methyl ester carboxylesterase [Rudaeicoccus suwonensis]
MSSFETGVAHTTDGAEIYWESHGSGPVLLLVAGQACSGRCWESLVPQLSDQHRVLLFDHRGVGRSTSGDLSGTTTRSFATDVVTLLDHVGAQSVSVFGHSMGGRISQWLAVDHPERVERLVLASTTGGDRRGVQRDPAISAQLAYGDMAAMARLSLTDAFREQHPDVVDAFVNNTLTPAARRAHFEASRDHDAWDAVHRITAPTLVIHGQNDQLTPPGNAQLLAERIPQVSLIIEPGQRHCAHLESDRLQHEVIEFLSV